MRHMDQHRDDALIRRLHLTFELHDAGVAIKRESLRRAYPTATEAEIADHLRRWLNREGEPLDGPETPRPRGDEPE